MRLWWAVLVAELRQTLRDANTLIFSVLFPLFLLPGALWGAGQASAVADGWRASIVPRVAVEAGLAVELPERIERVAMGEPADAELVREGAGYRLRYRSDDPVSALAQSRLAAALDPPWEVTRVDVAPATESSAFVFARGLPLVLLVLSSMATLYPAIEAVVADRERSVEETLRVTAAPAWVFTAGKYAAVAVLAQATLLATLAGTLVTLFHFVSMSSGSLGVPPLRLVAMVPFASASSLGAAAITLLGAAPAKDFKQAQNTATVAVMVLLGLFMLSTLPGSELDGPLGWVPFTNAALCMREVLLGRAVGAWGALAIGELLVLTAVAGVLGARVAARRAQA